MIFYKDENKIYMFDIDNGLILKDLPKGIYKVNQGQNISFEKINLDNLPKLDGKEYKRIKNKVIKNKANAFFIGKSGFGKSLLVKHIIKEFENNYHIFIIEKINTNIIKELALKFENVIFVFDEFEKNYIYKKSEDYDDNDLRQDELLSLLDGMYPNNHIYLFTANDERKINPYLLNRPGRIRYKFVFRKIDPTIIKEYFGENELLLKLNNYNLLSMDILKYLKEEKEKGYSIEESLSDLGFSKELILLLNKKHIEYNYSFVKKIIDFKIHFISFNQFQIEIDYIDEDGDKNDIIYYSEDIIDIYEVDNKVFIKINDGYLIKFY